MGRFSTCYSLRSGNTVVFGMCYFSFYGMNTPLTISQEHFHILLRKNGVEKARLPSLAGCFTTIPRPKFFLYRLRIVSKTDN